MYLDGIQAAAESSLPWEQLKKKSILITGATGLIGRCMIDVLMYKNMEEGLNCHVYALSRSEQTARTCFSKDYFINPYFCYWKHDVQFPMKLEKVSHVDYVLHLASNTHPVAYATEPIATIITNIYGTKNLLDFSVKYGVKRFVFPSSVEIYGENRGDVEKFDENYVGYLNSNTMRAGYPESKRCGEALCQAYIKEKNLDIVIPRLPRVFGPTMQKGDSKAVAQFINKAINKEDIVLKSSGNQHYSFLYVVDAVIGILTALFQGKCGEAYNIADENNDATLKKMAEYIAHISGTRVVFALPDELERSGYSTATKARLDGTKIHELGWRPLYTVERGLQETISILKGLE